MHNFRKLAFGIIASLLTLTSCGGGISIEENSYSSSKTSGKPGLFSLVSPTLGENLESVPSFSWTKSDNADRYMIEIASSSSFITNNSAYVYYKQDYLTSTTCTITSSLSQKDTTYYWRVTAYSGNSSLLSNNVFNFFLKSPDYDEVDFSLGEPTDWSTHEQGAPVDLSIDTSNFFSNDEESLAVKFQKEDTKPIGWIVITRTIELDTYGTDAFYFRFYYSGDDATAYIRLIDNDGEFWKAKVELSNNCKQICILPFTSFTQTTALVTVNNHIFDYFHIKRVELVFEQTWGDGACLISDLKCIKKSNYENLFIDKLNFNDYPSADWKFENDYNFGYSTSEDGASYTLVYDTAANELNSVGMASKGYGFTKIYVKRFFDEGDTIKVSLKYSGSSAGKASLRIGEEDGDLWYFMVPYSSLSTEEFTTLYLPFESFASSYLGGNGRREFSFINMIQFGLTNMYGSGSLTYKDFEIVTKSETKDIETGPRSVEDDGLIESFDSYNNPAEPFYQWQLSTSNKDEYISLNTLQARGANNTYCGSFAYKADMIAATYTLPLDIKGTSFDGISLYLKDASVKSDKAAFDYLDEVSAICDIALTLNSGDIAYYRIEKLAKVWTLYEIPFSALSFQSGSGTIDSTSIASFSLAFSYVYYDEDGTADPTYMMANPVYADNIYLIKDAPDAFKATTMEKSVAVDELDSTKATIETAESYSSSSEALGVWEYGNDNKSNNLELSNNVSKEGGSHSLKLNYESFTSASYALPITINASSILAFKCKGLDIDILGDEKATVYINLYLMVNGSTYQVRHNIEKGELASVWTRYKIGFGTFDDYASPSTAVVSASNIVNLYKITIGIVNSDYSASAIYVDNIKLDNAITRDTQNAEAI